MTTTREQERNLTNLRRSRVSELLSKGYTNQSEIAKILNVSEPTICRDVKWFRKCAKETFHTFLQEKLPEEFEKAITTYDYVIRTASSTADTTHDDRIKMQALHEVRETRTAKMDLISNVDVMNYQVNKDKKGSDVQILEHRAQPVSSSNEDSIGEEQEQEQEESK